MGLIQYSWHPDEGENRKKCTPSEEESRGKSNASTTAKVNGHQQSTGS